MTNKDDENNPRHDEVRLSPAEQAAVEATLSAFAPRSPRVDRDRLMFLAGRASRGDVENKSADTLRGDDDSTSHRVELDHSSRLAHDRIWRNLALAMTAVSAMLAYVAFARSGNDSRTAQVSPRVGPSHVANSHNGASAGSTNDSPEQSSLPSRSVNGGTPSAAVHLSDDHQFRLREIALREGAESLPEPLRSGGAVTSMSAGDIRRLGRPRIPAGRGLMNSESTFESL